MGEGLRLPFAELLGSVPGFFGIRLEEEPKFEIIETDEANDVQIRRYAPALLAEVTIDANHDDAVDQGFERLAKYIFGGNASHTTMAMTTPVSQRTVGDKLSANSYAQGPSEGPWTISFFLANNLTPSEAPKPDDPTIRLVVTPERLVAVARYTGNNTDERRIEARKRLHQWVADNERYRAASHVSWAQYDQPFAIPFLKRNEAQLEIQVAG